MKINEGGDKKFTLHDKGGGEVRQNVFFLKTGVGGGFDTLKLA